MVRKLIWSKLSHQHKYSIFRYWNNRNKSKTYSIKLNILFNNAVKLLVDYPNIGERTDYKNVRLKLVRDYWMVYRVTVKNIQILAIWNTNRDPEDFDKLIKSFDSA